MITQNHMKKLLGSLFILSILLVGTQVHASTLSDALLKIENLQKEIAQLRASLQGAVAVPISTIPVVQPLITVFSPNGGENIKMGDKYNITWESRGPLSGNNVSLSLKKEGATCSSGVIGCQSEFNIAYNIENKGSYIWDTNLKMSGASTGPNSVSVIPGAQYRIGVCGLVIGVCDYSDTAFTINPATTPVESKVLGKISYWWGKYNLHTSNGIWVSDTASDAGAGLEMMSYCKRWFPGTTEIREGGVESIKVWQSAGNYPTQTASKPTYQCVASSIIGSATGTVSIDKSYVSLNDKVNVSGTATNTSTTTQTYKVAISLLDESLNKSNNLANISAKEFTLVPGGKANISSQFTTMTAGYNFAQISVYLKTGNTYNLVSQKIERVTVGATTSTPSITVLSPNGGEIYQAGQQITVKWRAINMPDARVNVTLLNSNNVAIDENTDLINTDHVTFKLPVTPGQYSFKINTKNYGTVYDMSDSTFTITSATTPSITVLYPNGGENFVQGASNKISWNGGNTKVQVGLVNYSYTEGENNPGIIGWIELNGQPNGSVTWDGISLKSLSGGGYWTITPGKYKIIVVTKSQTGNYCTYSTASELDCNSDISDKSFTISSSTSNVPVISGVSGPQSLKTYEGGTWKVTASDSKGGDLSYSVVWGDEGYGLTSSTGSSKNYKQTATFTHSYSRVGTFNPTFTVTNSEGGSTSTSLSVNVFDPTIDDGCLNGEVYSSTTGQRCPSVVYWMSLLSPQAGLTLNAGEIYNVKWSSNIPNYAIFTIKIKDDQSRLIRTIQTQNDDQETVKIPVMTPPGTYKLEISNGSVMNPIVYANAVFNVASSTNNGCLSGEIYSSTTGQICPVRTCSSSGAGCYNSSYLSSITRTLKVGIKGEDVKSLQSFLGINADGSYGPMTRSKVMEWQVQNGLTPDGAFGMKSAKKAGLAN